MDGANKRKRKPQSRSEFGSESGISDRNALLSYSLFFLFCLAARTKDPNEIQQPKKRLKQQQQQQQRNKYKAKDISKGQHKAASREKTRPRANPKNRFQNQFLFSQAQPKNNYRNRIKRKFKSQQERKLRIRLTEILML